MVYLAKGEDRRDPRDDAERFREQTVAIEGRSERQVTSSGQLDGRVRRVRSYDATSAHHRLDVHRAHREAHQAAHQGQVVRRRRAQSASRRDALRVQETDRARLGEEQSRPWTDLRAGVLETAAETNRCRFTTVECNITNRAITIIVYI